MGQRKNKRDNGVGVAVGDSWRKVEGCFLGLYICEGCRPRVFSSQWGADCCIDMIDLPFLLSFC